MANYCGGNPSNRSSNILRTGLRLAAVFLLLFGPVRAESDHTFSSVSSPDDFEVVVVALPGVDLYGFNIDADGRLMGRYQDEGTSSGAFVRDGAGFLSRSENIRPSAIGADGTLVGWSGIHRNQTALVLGPDNTPLPTPFSRGRIQGINRYGQFAGVRQTPDGEEIVLALGRFQQVLAGAQRCRIAGLNDAGQVAFSLKEERGFQAYLWDGENRTIGDLGGGESLAGDMNQRGDIVGRSRLPDGSWHAFLWSEGQMKDLGTLGGAYSHALAVNEQRVVVGWSRDDQGFRHNVMWKDGEIIDLDPLLGEMGVVFGLNDRNQMVGWQKGPHGHWQALIVTPRSG